jgi:hypothetical protein
LQYLREASILRTMNRVPLHHRFLHAVRANPGDVLRLVLPGPRPVQGGAAKGHASLGPLTLLDRSRGDVEIQLATSPSLPMRYWREVERRVRGLNKDVRCVVAQTCTECVPHVHNSRGNLQRRLNERGRPRRRMHNAHEDAMLLMAAARDL